MGFGSSSTLASTTYVHQVGPDQEGFVRSYSRDILRAIHAAADARAAEPYRAWKDNTVPFAWLPWYLGKSSRRTETLVVRVEIRTDEFYEAVDVEGLREKAVAQVISWLPEGAH